MPTLLSTSIRNFRKRKFTLQLAMKSRTMLQFLLGRQVLKNSTQVCISLRASVLKYFLAGFALLEHWQQKWSSIPRVWQALEKFYKSWLKRPAYVGWFYRFADSLGLSIFSVATNNGLEGTNNILKKDYTNRELLGVSKFILLVEQFVGDCSSDPEREVRGI